VSFALEVPLRQLIQNASVYNKAKLLSETAGGSPDSVGFNAETEKIEDLAQAGIFDSAKALTEALVLAFAYARGVVTTGAWDVAPRATHDFQKEL